MILKAVLRPPHSCSGMHVSILSSVNTRPMYNTQSPTERKKAAIKPLVHDQELFLCVQPIAHPPSSAPVCSATSLLPSHRTHGISPTCHIFNMPQSLKSWLYALPVPSASPRVGKQSRHLSQCFSQCQCPCGRHGLHGFQMSYQLLQHQVICEFSTNFRQ